MIRQDANRPINRNRLLQDIRLHLTVFGAAEAAKLESKYADVITREDFERATTEIRQEMDALPQNVKAYLGKRYARQVNPDPEE